MPVVNSRVFGINYWEATLSSNKLMFYHSNSLVTLTISVWSLHRQDFEKSIAIYGLTLNFLVMSVSVLHLKLLLCLSDNGTNTLHSDDSLFCSYAHSVYLDVRVVIPKFRFSQLLYAKFRWFHCHFKILET
jgi:hypothetical protein